VDVQVTGEGSLFHTHFTHEKVKDVRDVFRADRGKLLNYHMHLIMSGVFFLPTRTGALGTAHSESDIERLLTEAETFAKKN
ncbi:aspartate aminotransferase family protein, partial [Candidatus Bathyarchaeota archaeon]|nr:aspartate aminotransferase family protein [Candidatus Bathyarchaeota archaeon]